MSDFCLLAHPHTQVTESSRLQIPSQYWGIAFEALLKPTSNWLQVPSQFWGIVFEVLLKPALNWLQTVPVLGNRIFEALLKPRLNWLQTPSQYWGIVFEAGESSFGPKTALCCSLDKSSFEVTSETSIAASHSRCQASTKIGATPAHTGKVHTQVVSCLCFVSTERTRDNCRTVSLWTEHISWVLAHSCPKNATVTRFRCGAEHTVGEH